MAELSVRVLNSLYPHVYLAQNQLVFLDRGSEDGLVPGNRLLVVRRGDAWRQSLKTTTDMARPRALMHSPEDAQVELTPLRGEQKNFPDEIIGELRVLRTERFSGIALVTLRARIVPGRPAVRRVLSVLQCLLRGRRIGQRFRVGRRVESRAGVGVGHAG